MCVHPPIPATIPQLLQIPPHHTWSLIVPLLLAPALTLILSLLCLGVSSLARAPFLHGQPSHPSYALPPGTGVSPSTWKPFPLVHALTAHVGGFFTAAAFWYSVRSHPVSLPFTLHRHWWDGKVRHPTWLSFSPSGLKTLMTSYSYATTLSYPCLGSDILRWLTPLHWHLLHPLWLIPAVGSPVQKPPFTCLDPPSLSCPNLETSIAWPQLKTFRTKFLRKGNKERRKRKELLIYFPQLI